MPKNVIHVSEQPVIPDSLELLEEGAVYVNERQGSIYFGDVFLCGMLEPPNEVLRLFSLQNGGRWNNREKVPDKFRRLLPGTKITITIGEES